MEESLPTWSLQHGSVRHLTLQQQHNKEALRPRIKTAYQVITGSLA